MIIKRKNIQVRSIFLCLMLVITFFSFLPSLNNDFTYWDDNNYVLSNPLIKDLSWQGIKKTFFSLHRGLYKPLVMLSFALEYHFFGLLPFIYHFTNLILHLLNCWLVFWLISLLGAETFSAFIVAVLFGVHPMHVESVAWISERKDMLYSLFFLSGLIAYLYYRLKKINKFYWFVLFFFILSLLSKPMALTFPFILLLCDYLTGSINKSPLKEKIPFFGIMLIFGLFTMFSAKEFIEPQPYFSFFDNFLVAVYAVFFYLYKLFFPLNLSCLYPYPEKNGNLLPPIFLIYPAVFLLVIWQVILTGKYTKKIIFGALFFFFMILPVIQLVPTASTIAADRYTYLSSIGVFYIFAELFTGLYQKTVSSGKHMKNFLIAGLTGVIIIFSFLTYQRCKVWGSNLTLWNDVLKKYPNQATAYNGRGGYYSLKKEYDKAIIDYSRVIELRPNHSGDYINRGLVYIHKGEYDKAVFDYSKALGILYEKSGVRGSYPLLSSENDGSRLLEKKEIVEIYNQLAVAFGNIGRYQEEISLLTAVIEIEPESAQGYNNLSVVYGITGNYQEAVRLASKSIELNPNLGESHNNLAVAYFYQGNYSLAFPHAQKALDLGFKVDVDFLKQLEQAKEDNNGR